MRKQRVVKLGASQLRQIITEAIQVKQFGEPEPFALTEVDGAAFAEFSADHSELATLVEDFLRERWTSQFSADDPVQSKYGDSAWAEQVENAIAATVPKIVEVLGMAERDLHNGEFTSYWQS